MKKILFVAASAVLVVVMWNVISGFTNPVEEKLRKRIVELEKQLSEASSNDQQQQCSFNYFNSSADLAKFIAKNYENPAYSFNTVGVHSDSLKASLQEITASYKGTVYVSIVHTSKGKEFDLSIPAGKICNLTLCCPPRCRYEQFGLLTIPKAVK